jgi:cellulose synthase/poly-beta-1,6-N-acetylglucosamine synthase-like glycosyltransferase
MGSVLVVAGPVGLFRRSALEDVYLRFGAHQAVDNHSTMTGPYEGSTFAEDFDLSLAILSLGYRIVYEPKAISHTTAPNSAYTLLNQRYRWFRGSLQTLLKYSNRTRSNADLRRGRVLAWLVTTYLFDIVAMPVYVISTAALLTYLSAGGDALLIVHGLLAYFAVTINTQAHIISIHQDSLKLLAFAPLYDFYQGLLLNNAFIIAAFDQIRGKAMRW